MGTTSNSTPPPFRQIHRSKMKYIHSEETLTVPEGVKVTIKSRLVTVEGPRGKLTKNLNHLAVNFSHPKEGCYQHRIAPRCPKERRYPPHGPNPHQQPDHRCHQGLQVQDEICLRTFPH